MKLIISTISLGMIGTSANYAFLAQTDQWFLELAKSWPFGFAIILVVWFFLRHLKEINIVNQSQAKSLIEENNRFFEKLTERAHATQDKATDTVAKIDNSLNILRTTIVENTRALDRMAQRSNENPPK